ncbi:purine-nucleoside phosphorylase [Candidatus Uhrbacteria bacterium]|nr:purine-nucleoside phosphorylase [Candidatus Uhrbacteria bacterium]
MRSKERELVAMKAAKYIEHRIGEITTDIAMVLGTGWSITLDEMRVETIMNLEDIPGFEHLKQLPQISGHERRLIYGKIGGVPLLALQGRIHMNESLNQELIGHMVRLQVEMLLQLGVKTLILTCAAGSLHRAIPVGSIVVINGFVTLWAPENLEGGEFCNPEDTLSEKLQHLAFMVGRNGEIDKTLTTRGGYAMLRGPSFEGRRYDKKLIRDVGGIHCVGMSIIPEARVAALYEDVDVLGLAFITNNDTEEHSHDTNLNRALAAGPRLKKFITLLLYNIFNQKIVETSFPSI